MMTLVFTAAVLLSLAAVFALPSRVATVKVETSDHYGELKS